MSAGVSGVRRVWTGYIGLRHLKEENEALKRQLAEAQVALQGQRALADRSRGLERLLDLRDQSTLTTVAADIIGASATPDFRTITIDKGTSDGLKPNMSVIAPAGVVGRVVVPSSRAAKVQLLIDRNAAAGAIIERSRAQGLAIGGGDDRLRTDLRVGGGRHRGRRRGDDVGHRRDLPEGIRRSAAWRRWRRTVRPTSGSS